MSDIYDDLDGEVSALEVIASFRERIEELEAQLAAVRAVIDDLERQLLHAVHLLRKELAGGEDGSK